MKASFHAERNRGHDHVFFARFRNFAVGRLDFSSKIVSVVCLSVKLSLGHFPSITFSKTIVDRFSVVENPPLPPRVCSGKIFKGPKKIKVVCEEFV